MAFNSYENGTSEDSFVIAGKLYVNPEPGANLSTTWLDGGAIKTDGGGNMVCGNLSPNMILGGQSSTSPVLASAGTIASSGLVTSRVAPAAAVTGVILQAGIASGQLCAVVNESVAASTVTFAASGTSNVAGGTTVSIAGLVSRVFVWDSVTSLWY